MTPPPAGQGRNKEGHSPPLPTAGWRKVCLLASVGCNFEEQACGAKKNSKSRIAALPLLGSRTNWRAASTPWRRTRRGAALPAHHTVLAAPSPRRCRRCRRHHHHRRLRNRRRGLRPGLCLRHRHLPPPEARHRRPLATTSIAAGAVAASISDAMIAKSTASATATLLLQLHKVAARSI